MGAFLDEDDDLSLEEMKNRQNAALTSVCSKDSLKGAVGGCEFHILPVSRSADLIETAAEQDLLCASEESLLSNSRNGLCPPPCGSTAADSKTHNGDKGSPRSLTSSSSACLLSPMSNLMAEFERMSLLDEVDRQPRERRCSGGSGGSRQREGLLRDSYTAPAAELISSVGRLSLGGSSEDSVFAGSCSERLWKGDRRDNLDEGERRLEERGTSGSDEYMSAEESLEGGGLRTRGTVVERTFCSRSKSWDHGGRDMSSSGSSGSYKSLDSPDFILRTPPRYKKGLFIEG